MSWMQKLYRTYEYIQEQDLDDENLALPFHMSKAVHLKVILNDKAELVGAEPIKKQLPIQITEDSSKRSGSTIAPYALHDGLQYIAKTAEKYLTIEYLNEIAKKKAPQKGGKKWQEFLTGTDEDKQKFANKEKEKYKKCFESYESQLSGWAKFGNLQEIEIVLQYIQKGSLIEDLLDKEIFSFKDNILLSGKDDPFDLTIVWAIDMSGLGDLHSDLWDKPCIQNQWIEYQESLIQKGRHKSLCCITGDLDYPTEAYPRINGNAKLVSADGGSTGFTFRGRFYGDKDNGAKSELGSQAVILGKNASHKAFSTLKWLINRQGIRNGKQVILIWSSNCISDEDKLLSSLYWDEDDIYASLLSEDKVDHSANLGFETAEQLKKKLHGYKEKLAINEQISLLIVDEPSKIGGRMSLTFYQEKLRNDYFRGLDEWQDDFAWYQEYKSSWPFIAPSLERIAKVILTKTEFEDKNRKLRRQLYARLLPVIAGGTSVPIPEDLVQKSFQVACNPFTNHRLEDGEKIRSANWQRNIGVACALYKGWCARKYPSQRRYSMSLDTENRSRDYLYGRLIAQAESMEWYALYLQNGKKTPTRATNAERYFQQFAQRPYSTWRNLSSEKLVPYQNYLTSQGKDFYKQAIGEIMELFQRDDYVCDDKLSGEFLLGYHCQKMENAREIAKRKAAKASKAKPTETN
ncbi:type I-C CRISPR-associated protein Cas8c/Csd1 [Neisseria sp. HMSC072F04]|jgi:CRISPR-associated protein, csd1 family|uniref:type I-C CRISPR-associated protein Cas8c/Csd1 n=1 Tax=Neisseria sicca TaxID=490 RepID=UPI0008A27BC8|nr:type I-C CRISPR-associated protein Cas8c/Csd1 [Neisseria sicca]OFJ85196.1 type I-C CRISPR-associated protein Cas8c/Csd1 [Neisseria sp. HMSC072F04]